MNRKAGYYCETHLLDVSILVYKDGTVLLLIGQLMPLPIHHTASEEEEGPRIWCGMCP